MINNFQELYDKLMQGSEDQRRIDRDLYIQELKASETRVKTELRQEMQANKKEIIASVSEIIDGGILPQIEEQHEKFDNHEKRIVVLETVKV